MVNKRTILLKIYLTPEENQDLQTRADTAQLSRSHYGRAALFSGPKLSSSGQPLQAQECRCQESYEALILQFGQHYSLLSLLQSDVAAGLEIMGPDSHPDAHPHHQPAHHSSMLEQLQRLQAEIAATQQVLQELAQHLHRQKAP